LVETTDYGIRKVKLWRGYPISLKLEKKKNTNMKTTRNSIQNNKIINKNKEFRILQQAERMQAGIKWIVSETNYIRILECENETCQKDIGGWSYDKEEALNIPAFQIGFEYRKLKYNGEWYRSCENQECIESLKHRIWNEYQESLLEEGDNE
jgi:hypothetical protein